VLPSPADPWARWFVFLTAFAATGSLLFRWTVLAPALAALPARAAARGLDADLRGLLGRMAAVSIALFMFASFMHLLVQASVVAGAPIWGIAPGDVRDVVQHTTWGRYWAVRAGLAIAAGVLLFVARRPASSRHPRLEQLLSVEALLLLLAGLATFSRSSHAAATPNLGLTAAIADYVHLLAAALWAGGLAALLVTLLALWRRLEGAERRVAFAVVAGQFTVAGALGLGALVLTGLFASWLQVGSIDALDTAYGVALRAKLVMVGVLAALGAVNLLWVRRRLAAATSAVAASRWLPRVVAGEVALAVLVLLATGFMTSLEPGRQTNARTEGPGIAFDQTDGGTRIRGRIEPGLPGSNRVRIELFDRRGERVEDASSVTTLVKYLDVELGETAVTATLAEDGRYVAENLVLSVAGTWQLQVRVTRPDAADATAAARFGIGGSADATAVGAASPETGRRLWAWMVVGLGALALVVAPRAWRGRIPRTRVRVVSTAVLVSGFVLAYGAHTHNPPPPVQAGVNPIPPDAQSIEAGRMLYAQECAQCHGALGLGDGPMAKTLNPPPLDLTVHVPLHGDGQIFQFISGGVPGTAMPVFGGGRLTDEQIWNLVNYLRTLAAPPPQR
jgi:copper transport protein